VLLLATLIHPSSTAEGWKNWRERGTAITVEKIWGEELGAPLNKEIDAPD